MSKQDTQSDKTEPKKAKAEAENTTPAGEGQKEQAQGVKEHAEENAESSADKSADLKAGVSAESSAEEKIAALEAQIAEIRDQLLRKAADLENFRKRTNQEKANAIEYANQSLLLDIIPVIDDFERAIQSGEKGLQAEASAKAEGSTKVEGADFQSFLEGIKMIEKRLSSQLEAKWGLKRFNSAGEPFDPNKHEALMMEKSPEVSEAVVKEDFQKGYYLKERVIRAAKVKVLMPC